MIRCLPPLPGNVAHPRASTHSGGISCEGPGSPQRRPLHCSRRLQRCRSPPPRRAPRPRAARRPRDGRVDAAGRHLHHQVAREVRRPPTRPRAAAPQRRQRRHREARARACTARSPRPAPTRSSWCSREFGDTRHSAYPDDPSSPTAPTFDGPLHNQIPKPDRKVDNSTLWDEGLQPAVLPEHVLQPDEEVLRAAVERQVLDRRRRHRVGQGAVQRGPLRPRLLRRHRLQQHLVPHPRRPGAVDPGPARRRHGP